MAERPDGHPGPPVGEGGPAGPASWQGQWGPPGYPPPGYPPPAYRPPGPPHTRPPRKRRSAALPLLLGAVVLVALAVAVAGVAFVVHRQDARSGPAARTDGRPAGAGATPVSTATATFARQPAIRYTRQITTSADDEVTVDLTVTQQGTTTGTFIQKGTKFGVLVVDDKTFFRAPAAYWVVNDASAKLAARFATQWVRVSPQRFGIDPQTLLAPAVLAAKFPQADQAGKQPAGPLTTVNGTQTREVSNADETVYVTTAQPYRIVRVKSTRDKFDLDITYLPDSSVPLLFRRLDTEVQQLTLAIDSQVVHSVEGPIVLSCGQSACTARATIDTVSTPYPQSTKSSAADVEIDFALDSRPIGTCSRLLTVPPTGKALAACKVTYREPADGRRHTIHTVVLATARAVLPPDITRIERGLAGEAVDWRLRQAGTTGLPGSSDQHGPFRFVPPPGYDPDADALQRTGSGYADADGNLWAETPPRGIAAKHGFGKEWKVKLSGSGLAKWRGSARQSKGGYYLYVTPDGQLSH
jgi:hypothetical protein